MVKQKLLDRTNTYTPTNTSPVRCNCGPVLNNPEDRDSVQGLKTSDNNSEVNQQWSHRAGSKLSNNVYVLNIDGKPLMPTTPRKARVLLRDGKAKVLGRKPFIIQLWYETSSFTQNITLGVDPGYKYLGLSAITDKKEVYAAEVRLRTDIVKLIAEKRMYRHVKRTRLWYRPKRVLNRGNFTKDWLAPSIRHNLDSTLRIVNRVHKLLPISKVIVEKAKFDIRKIMDPTICGSAYQEGEQKGFENVRQYVLFRDGYKCQNCGKRDVKLRAHHLESRQTGGNRPDNLITICEKCHELVHASKIKLKAQRKAGHKAESCMNIIRNRIMDGLDNYPNVQETYGYLTAVCRKELGIEKTHFNDAFCIANGKKQTRCGVLYYAQKRRNNRCLQTVRKRYGRSVRKKRYPFQPKDLVRYNGRLYSVRGTGTYGKQVVLNDGKSSHKVCVMPKLVTTIKYAAGLYCLVRQ